MITKKFILYFVTFIFLIGIGLSETEWLLGVDSIIYNENVLLSTNSNRVFSMLPMILLTICIISAFIDFASIGIISGSIISLIIGFVFGLIPITVTTLITIGLMGLLLIWRMIL